ncbi:hypothetical protein ACLKA7_008161 [Drosophila subpalustris]
MGLRTTVDIPCGAFICEYAGELLTLENNTDCRQPTQTTIVDPSRRGNIGRYLNHSCEPNCEVLAVRINSPIPKIGIFAKQNISANVELCFHYGGEEFFNGFSEGKPCLCTARNCTGVLPNTRV